MDNIFGIPMTSILLVVTGIMGLCLASSMLIAWRNPVIFRIALRNIPRRRAQSILIMVGLMLSTMIIAAALTTGDSLDHSFKRAAFDGLGEVDQTIAFTGDSAAEGTISASSPPIPASIADALEAQFQSDPDIAAFMPVLTIAAPVVNPEPGLSEPASIVSGIDPSRVDSFGGFTTSSGQPVEIASLPDGSAVISEDLAASIDAAAGDELTFYYQNQPHTVTVAAVVKGSILTGYEEETAQAGPAQTASNRLTGMAVPLEWLQSVAGLEGQARFIAVSNTGGVQQGLDRTGAAVAKLQQALATIEGGSELGINPIKQDSVESAELLGNTFMTFFVILGMFSIAAGILLIFLIFMMLAAERRAEMGMARAVGMKQRHLIQGFIAEGTAYALGAGLLGALMGVGAAVLMTTLISRLSGDNVDVTPYATFESLAVAYALGVTITFLTVIFASVRSSRLNIVAAIRDLPEDKHPERGEALVWRWWVTPRFMRATLPASMRLPVTALWNACMFLPRLAIWALMTPAYYLGWGPVIAIPGALLTALGVSMPSMFVFSFGLSVLVLGLALFVSKRLPARPVYTAAAGFMLLYWLLPMSVSERVLPDLGDGGPEMFFVSGIFMVAYATLIVMWNADLIVWFVSLFGRTFAHWLPAVKTAVAYPLASRGRTGLTVAMFSIVIFALVMVRTISGNFSELLLSDDARAGWDVVVVTNPSNPVEDLSSELAGSQVSLADISAFGTVDSLALENTQVRNPGEESWKQYPINGMDRDFVANTEAGLEARAPGYDSDEAVWNAILSSERVAVIDMRAFDQDEFGGNARDFRVPNGVRVVDGAIPAFSVEMRNPRTGTTEVIPVAGVLAASASTLNGIYISETLFDELYGTPDLSRIHIKMTGAASTGPGELAQEIESVLRSRGVQAISLQEQIEEQQASANSFFVMLQGFMGLGLLVGIAALGVTSFRSVVERRQQIGMLRAIGYRRRMVALSFLLESLVIATLGVVIGAALAVILAYNLIMEGGIDGTEFERFVVPWSMISLFVAASLVAAAVMTWIPARKAASVPIAEALRYE